SVVQDTGAPTLPDSITFSFPRVAVKDAVVAALRLRGTEWVPADAPVVGTPISFCGDVAQCTHDWLDVIVFYLLNASFLLRPLYPNDAPQPVKDFLDKNCSQFKPRSEPLGDFVRANLKGLVELFLAHDPACLALFDYLDDRMDSWPMSEVIFTPHSQGNL